MGSCHDSEPQVFFAGLEPELTNEAEHLLKSFSAGVSKLELDICSHLQTSQTFSLLQPRATQTAWDRYPPKPGSNHFLAPLDFREKSLSWKLYCSSQR